MKTNTKKAIAIALSGVVLFGLGGAIGAVAFPKVVTQEVVKYNTTERIVEVPVEKIVTETVEKVVNQTVEVEVPFEDTAFKKMACDRLLFDDLNECVEEVEAENAALELALKYIEEEFESEIADELEDQGIVSDEDDVKFVKLYSDFEDIEVLESDFDDEQYEFKVKVKYEDDDDKKFVYVTVKVDDGEVELVELE